jgi:hypothetical protein
MKLLLLPVVAALPFSRSFTTTKTLVYAKTIAHYVALDTTTDAQTENSSQ